MLWGLKTLYWLGSGGPILLPLGLTEFWELSSYIFQVRSSTGSGLRLNVSKMRRNEKELKSEIYAYIYLYGCHLFLITLRTLEKYYHYRKIEIKISCLYSNWTPPFCSVECLLFCSVECPHPYDDLRSSFGTKRFPKSRWPSKLHSCIRKLS